MEDHIKTDHSNGANSKTELKNDLVEKKTTGTDKTKVAKPVGKAMTNTKCNLCAYISISERSLELHMKRIHAPMFECDKCDKKFKEEAGLHHHQANSHQSNFECEVCEFKARNLKFLNLHKANKHISIPLVKGSGMKRDASVKSKSKVSPKRAKLNLCSQNSVPKETVSGSSEDELSFEEPKPWTKEPWLNSDREVIGVNLKGKAKIFKDCSSKVAALFKRRMKTFRVKDTQIKVIRHIFKKGALCCIVEVVSKEGVKDNIEATLFRPGGTIGLLRKPDVEHVLVEILCEVIECFLDKFMAGATEEEILGWSSRRVKPIPLKTSILACTLCPFETKTRVALKRHFSIVHEQE